ncbi:alpha/beta fold hydrolase [Chitinophaga sp. SYP-B3965]|uniref:alpha/beta fold hydrolase n=1 Tax=Chitinophaga sp. SYP-B3965 TaxID=2663120 RepID=UPI001299F3A3|nr:alpha/beta hydrolase [Chitinophaga sp. SYP-B3965]MRG48554.1 alpha/beta fold hydrolase [Chitinophaga sp. SYP-B3965]
MKPTLLLLHGALGAAQQFDTVTPTLSEQYTIHQFNFHGHGRTQPPAEGISIAAFTQQLLDYIHTNKLAPAAVFGYSMGGYVALAAALQQPEAFLKVGTLATKFNWTPETAAKETRMLDAKVLQEKVPAYVEQLKSLHGEPGWETLLTGTASLMQELGNDPPLTIKTLKNITIPVSVMVGELDAMVSVEETNAVFKSLPRGKMTILPGVKHPLEKVDSEVLIRAIRAAIN